MYFVHTGSLRYEVEVQLRELSKTLVSQAVVQMLVEHLKSICESMSHSKRRGFSQWHYKVKQAQIEWDPPRAFMFLSTPYI
eukprot:4223531-Amphidinium_carterae.2